MSWGTALRDAVTGTRALKRNQSWAQECRGCGVHKESKGHGGPSETPLGAGDGWRCSDGDGGEPLGILWLELGDWRVLSWGCWGRVPWPDPQAGWSSTWGLVYITIGPGVMWQDDGQAWLWLIFLLLERWPLSWTKPTLWQQQISFLLSEECFEKVKFHDIFLSGCSTTRNLLK